MIEQAKGGSLATWAYVACGALAVGSFGPWAGGPIGYSGIGNNGSLTLLAAGLAAVAVRHWRSFGRRAAAVVTLLVGVVCGAIGAYDLVEARSDPNSVHEWAWAHGVGWGLALVLGASIALVLLSVSMYRRSRARGRLGLSWKQAVLLVGVGMVFVVGLATVVSREPRRSGSHSLFLQGPGSRLDARDADKKILTLRPGMPPHSVMARLGPPEAVLILEEEALFTYGAWQITFTEGGLREGGNSRASSRPISTFGLTPRFSSA